MLTYEERLDADVRWALDEGGRHFAKESCVQRALFRITARLDDLGIPYAVAGDLAMFYHSYRRYTQEVLLLVRRDGLRQVHRALIGDDYAADFLGGKALREIETGVKIGFLVAGDYPGDKRPKPVTYPNPASKVVERDGVRCLALPKLIETLLTSGMSQPDRLRDIADVLELIRYIRLDHNFAASLDPSVRTKYLELWNAVDWTDREFFGWE